MAIGRVRRAGHRRRSCAAIGVVIGLACAGVDAQEDTRYQLYLHDPPPAAEAPAEEVRARPERRRRRDPARPLKPSRQVAYCNRRLHDGLDRCQANFGFASTTYFRCERNIYVRFGVACTGR